MKTKILLILMFFAIVGYFFFFLKSITPTKEQPIEEPEVKQLELNQSPSGVEAAPQIEVTTKPEPEVHTIQTQSIKVEEEEAQEENIEYDPEETIFDWFTEEEIEMIYRLVEAEATGGSIESKMNVANTIYNRYFSEEFPDTIEEIVFQKTGRVYQFSCIGDKRYYKVEVTKDTKEAVYRAFMEPDTTNGALFFCNKADVKNLSFQKWFNTLEFILKDDIGHSFYK